jgi:hypothetical protein
MESNGYLVTSVFRHSSGCETGEVVFIGPKAEEVANKYIETEKVKSENRLMIYSCYSIPVIECP